MNDAEKIIKEERWRIWFAIVPLAEGESGPGASDVHTDLDELWNIINNKSEAILKDLNN